MPDLLVTNGKVVFSHTVIEADIAIDEGKIVALGSSATLPKADKVVDAKGSFVLSGCIDPHVHINTQFMGASTKDDFFTATKATSSGGTTTIIDFATQQKGDLPLKAVHDRRAQADGKVAIDYSLHTVITDLTPEAVAQLKQLIDYGLPSFKLFMVYRKEGLMVDDGVLFKVFMEATSHGGLVVLHAENAAMIEFLVDEALREGHREAIYHALTRPPITEAEAVHRALFMANYLRAPYYNLHLSMRQGVDMFREARRRGQPVYAETCTHYLINTMDDLRGPNGINFICTPPLRTKEDQEALWAGLADGTLSAVSSDHEAFTTDMKKIGKDCFDKVPNGLPGHEFRLPVLFSEGVGKGRISVNRLSEITSTNIAKIVGLYPKKGAIALGSDADLVILDPKLEKTITPEESLYEMDWYPFEGMRVKGWPVVTISKGKIIWENGKFQGKQGEGEFLKRKLPPELSKRVIA